MDDLFPLQDILELACAAQRVNKDYIKEQEVLYTEDGKVKHIIMSNKELVKMTLKLDPRYSGPVPPKLIPIDLDKELAQEIRKYFRKLMFSAIEGDNEFKTEVNSLLNSESIPFNKIGFIACLPSVYKRDYATSQIEKQIKTLNEGYLSLIGSTVFDLDCEILESKRSKNYDAFNITAIIDNKMVSWFSKVDLKIGACVIVKAKVKDHSKHWKHQNDVTRLNYVKAAQ
jgi:hypothetical protein